MWPTMARKAWINKSIILRYLQHLHYKNAKKEPCALVIDRYRAHLTKKVKKLAKKLQIELIFVPTNGTSEFQPLDS